MQRALHFNLVDIYAGIFDSKDRQLFVVPGLDFLPTRWVYWAGLAPPGSQRWVRGLVCRERFYLYVRLKDVVCGSANSRAVKA
jgi:hypothetical protein